MYSFSRKSKSATSQMTIEANEQSITGCVPIPKVIKLEMKMTLVLIGISVAFILLTIPHR